MNILLFILISVILVGNIIFLVHHAGLYPFLKEARRPRENFFTFPSKFMAEKKPSHGYQVHTGWNDLLRRNHLKKLYDSKDPASALDKVINQYMEDPSEKNYDVMVHLSNHISNRVRYDDQINALIEKISDLTVNIPTKA